MRVTVFLYLCGCAIARDALAQFEKSSDNLRVLNKSLAGFEEAAKKKVDKFDSFGDAATDRNYANEEPFRPITSSSYDQFHSGSPSLTQSLFDKNQANSVLNSDSEFANDFKNGLTGKQMNLPYRAPFSSDSYQQQFKQAQKSLNSNNALQNNQFSSSQSFSPNRDRLLNYQFQSEQQSLSQQPTQTRSETSQTPKVQYVIAIPMSYVRHLLQQQQQPQQQNQPYYPAPAVPPQPLPASQIAATPTFAALDSHRPVQRSPQHSPHIVPSSPTPSGHGYGAPVQFNPVQFNPAAAPGYAPQPLYRPVYQPQLLQPVQHPQLLAPVAQYQVYHQQQPRPPTPIYGHVPMQSAAATVPVQLVQAPVGLRYAPQPNLIPVHHPGVQQVAPSHIQPQVQLQPLPQLLPQPQQYGAPYLQYGSPVVVPRVQLQQQAQQLVNQPTGVSPGPVPYIKLTPTANAYAPVPSQYYSVVPSAAPQHYVYGGNKAATPYQNLIIQQPNSGHSPPPTGGQFSYYPQTSSAHYGSHPYQSASATVATKTLETMTPNATSNSYKSVYDFNSNSDVQTGPKKSTVTGISNAVKYP